MARRRRNPRSSFNANTRLLLHGPGEYESPNKYPPAQKFPSQLIPTPHELTHAELPGTFVPELPTAAAHEVAPETYPAYPATSSPGAPARAPRPAPKPHVSSGAPHGTSVNQLLAALPSFAPRPKRSVQQTAEAAVNLGVQPKTQTQRAAVDFGAAVSHLLSGLPKTQVQAPKAVGGSQHLLAAFIQPAKNQHVQTLPGQKAQQPNRNAATAVLSSNPSARPAQNQKDPLGKKTLGNVTGKELAQAQREGTLKVSKKGVLTTQKGRRVVRNLREAQKAVANSGPNIQALAAKFPELSPEVLKSYADAARRTGVPPQLLAGIQNAETTYGTSTLPGVHSGQNFAGAAGPFQIGNGTGASGNAWQGLAEELWGSKASEHSIYNQHDAALVAGQYLAKTYGHATSDPATWQAAAESYNHSESYARGVVATALEHQALGKLGQAPDPQAKARLKAAEIAAEGAGIGPKAFGLSEKKGFGGPAAHYANPLPASDWSPARSDQGYDALPLKGTASRILAVGKGKVIAIGAPGWPGGGGVTYELLEGPQKGKEIYVFESVGALVKPGQTIHRGQVIAKYIETEPSSIETGYYTGNPTTSGHPYNNQLISNPSETYSVENSDGSPTIGSAEFEKQILGKAVEVPGIGGGGSLVTPGGSVVSNSAVATYASETGSTPAAVRAELKSERLSPGALGGKGFANRPRVQAGEVPVGEILAGSPFGRRAPTGEGIIQKLLERQA